MGAPMSREPQGGTWVYQYSALPYAENPDALQQCRHDQHTTNDGGLVPEHILVQNLVKVEATQ